MPPSWHVDVFRCSPDPVLGIFVQALLHKHYQLLTVFLNLFFFPEKFQLSSVWFGLSSDQPLSRNLPRVTSGIRTKDSYHPENSDRFRSSASDIPVTQEIKEISSKEKILARTGINITYFTAALY